MVKGVNSGPPARAGVIAAACSAISIVLAPMEATAEPRLSVVASDRCIMTDWPPPQQEKFFGLLALLGPAILPRVIDWGLGFASDRLRSAAGERGQTVEVAQTSGYFLKADVDSGVFLAHPNLTCVIVAHGETNARGAVGDRIDTRWAAKADSFGKKGLAFQADPNFYYEGIIHFSEDGQSFKIRTAYLYYGGSIGSGRSRRGNKKVAISFSFEDGAGRPFAESAIPLNELESGVALDAEALGISLADIEAPGQLDAHALAQFETDWMAALGPDETSVARLVDDCTTYGCPRVAAPSDDEDEAPALQARPYTLKVQLTESAEPNAILKFLADAVDTARPAAGTALASQLLPKSVYDPNNPDWWAKRQAAYDACNKYKEAQAAVAASPFDASPRIESQTAYRDLQAAYAAAGLPTFSLYVDTILSCRLTGG